MNFNLNRNNFKTFFLLIFFFDQIHWHYSISRLSQSFSECKDEKTFFHFSSAAKSAKTRFPFDSSIVLLFHRSENAIRWKVDKEWVKRGLNG
jgi:hypothetical protein